MSECNELMTRHNHNIFAEAGVIQAFKNLEEQGFLRINHTGELDSNNNEKIAIEILKLPDIK